MVQPEKLTLEQADELLLRQAALQSEAQQIVQQLDLVQRLAPLGEVRQIGSTVTGLMVWRDIDFIATSPGLDADFMFKTLHLLLAHPHVREAHYFNESGSFNESGGPQDERYYFGILYHPAGIDWKIDISCWLEDAPRPEPEEAKKLSRQLTDETRLAILWIKDTWYPLPTYRKQVLSIDIYDAVLEHGVRTPSEFDAYLVKRSKPARPLHAFGQSVDNMR